MDVVSACLALGWTASVAGIEPPMAYEAVDELAYGQVLQMESVQAFGAGMLVGQLVGQLGALSPGELVIVVEKSDVCEKAYMALTGGTDAA